MDNSEIIEIIRQAKEEKWNSLQFDYCEIELLPPELFQLTDLEFLYIDSCKIYELPQEIKKLSKLIVLSVEGCSLKNLPKEIANLEYLRELRLDLNDIKEIPPGIWSLSNLDILSLSYNSLDYLPSDVRNLLSLKELNIDGNNIAYLPAEIGHLVNLELLALSGNPLEYLPREIGQLCRLKRMDLEDCWLQSLPAEIGRLHNLEYLDLSANKIKLIPADIKNLRKLKRVDIEKNELESIPDEIGNLTQVEYFDMGGNKIKSLPKEIGNLSKLKQLFLENNCLESLPDEIGQLESLIFIDVSNNQITYLPEEIGALTELRAIYYWGGNEFRNLHGTIGARWGGEYLAEFLKEQFNGKLNRWLSKLVIIGEGGVGKTSLINSLQSQNSEVSLVESTRGFDSDEFVLNHPNHDDVTMHLRVWDFGGQDIYHAAHHYFLTDESLYILVWSSRLGYYQCRLEYWINIIQARAPNSPILVVATWLDEVFPQLPKDEIKRKFPNVCGFHSVSNKTGEGVAELRDLIATISANLPLMGITWPKSWLRVAIAIENLTEEYIPAEQLWSLMDEHKIDKDRQSSLAEWLHQLGDIIFFQDDLELNDQVIVKPNFVSKAISEVLDKDSLIRNGGILTADILSDLWKRSPTSPKRYLLTLMERYGLLYKTGNMNDLALVLDCAPLEEPANFLDFWEEAIRDIGSQEISIKYRLNVLPPGIPTWFIARSHRFLTEIHWRYGAIFHYDESGSKYIGYIRTDLANNELQLVVRGSAPYNFFALLKDGLDITLERYPGVSKKTLLPCPGHGGEKCAYEFDYEDIQRALSMGVNEVLCFKTYKNVSITGLLLGLDWLTKDNIIEKLETIQELSETQHKETVALLQRLYLRDMRQEQSRIETICPNVFTLRPCKKSGWKKIMTGDQLELQLYCQAPGKWHPTVKGRRIHSPENGLYKLDYLPKWLQKMGPYIQEMTTILKFITPIMGPWIQMSVQSYAKLIEAELKFMEKLVENIPDIEDSPSTKLAGKIRTRKFPDSDVGPALRLLNQLLHDLDDKQIWGGLEQIITPEGTFLWLCPHHAEEYKMKETSTSIGW